MGATVFAVKTDVDDVAAAYSILVEQAYWEYGHGGYTGTIAEKNGYVTFEPPDGVNADDVHDEIESNCYFKEEGRWYGMRPSDQLIAWFGPDEAEKLIRIYDDKWGPAVAIADGEGWLFCGYASC